MKKKLLLILPILGAALVLFLVFSSSTLVFAQNNGKVDPLLHASQRGCASCHRVVKEKGVIHDYTLYNEVKEKVPDHPAIDKKKADTQGVLYCLICHDNMGTKSFRNIIHPIHFFSSIFTQKLHGNCFSCHDISSKGQFVLWDEVKGKYGVH